MSCSCSSVTPVARLKPAGPPTPPRRTSAGWWPVGCCPVHRAALQMLTQVIIVKTEGKLGWCNPNAQKAETPLCHLFRCPGEELALRLS